MGFFVPARRIPRAAMWTSGEDFDTAGTEKTAKLELSKILRL